jgi:mRNA-degrading endonuclease YafQ of YafQ-DinJ toxin-antitoxin module
MIVSVGECQNHELRGHWKWHNDGHVRYTWQVAR